MPGGDGTGPAGMGPMTGRAAGYCAGYPVPGYMNPTVPRMGMGWGFRRGWRAAGYAPYGAAWPTTPPAVAPGVQPFAPGVQPGFGYGMTQEQETEVLKNQAQMLGQQLEQINKRLEELEKVEE